MKKFRLLGLLWCSLLVGGLGAAPTPASGAFPPGPDRNLFAALLGKSEAELDGKLAAAWQQLFHGDDRTQRLYFPVGDDLAYLADVGSGDVRTEGMSYGLMLAVQTDHRAEFDRLWRWADKFMRHAAGPRRGYFAWHCRYNGTSLDPGSASDGEEWIAMALFIAAHRWGHTAGGINYEAEAQDLLREMLHKPRSDGVTPIFDPAEKQVVFAPNPDAADFTDPSYQLPAFYDCWAAWASDPADRQFWAEAAATSRRFFHAAAHPVTGLMPEYSGFDGRPDPRLGAGREDFRFDAWRTPANVGLDYAWWHADPWQVGQSNRLLRFLASHWPKLPNQFTLEGRPLSTDVSIGLIAMAAVAGQAADPDLARPFVRRLWDAPVPAGRWRYYDGLLYFLGLLEAGGRFRTWDVPLASSPAAAPR